jgi:hypothetical protein
MVGQVNMSPLPEAPYCIPRFGPFLCPHNKPGGRDGRLGRSKRIFKKELRAVALNRLADGVRIEPCWPTVQSPPTN